MKILFYVLATAAGLFGALGLFRTFEHLLAGDGLRPIQLAFGVVGVLLAIIWVKRARLSS